LRQKEFSTTISLRNRRIAAGTWKKKIHRADLATRLSVANKARKTVAENQNASLYRSDQLNTAKR
jgi:hypothetical protein